MQTKAEADPKAQSENESQPPASLEVDEPEGLLRARDLSIGIAQEVSRHGGGITMRLRLMGVGEGHSTPERNRKLNAKWVPPGDTCTVAGLRLPGMVYLGTGSGGDVPCLLDDSLPVAHGQPDFAGSSMGYWPSYERITPMCRAAFLRWLADGRSDPRAYIGYVFLFFYGLERRLLVDMATGDLSVAQDVLPITGEVQRLLSIYGTNGSFRRYATSFLGFLSAVAANPEVWPAGQSGTLNQPQEWQGLRASIGRSVKATGSVAADLAFAWVISDPEVQLRTPAQRCAAEFRDLFHHRFRARFGAGLAIDAGTRMIRAAYRPASAGMPEQVRKTDLPDVTSLPEPRRELLALAEDCTVSLEQLSRFLGRSAEARGTVETMALLPKELAVVPASGPVADLKSRLAGAVAEDGLVAFSSLLDGVITRSEDDKISRKDMAKVIGVMKHLGYGLEPDQRFGGVLPSWETDVVVFQTGPDAPDAPSDEYAAAAMLMHLAVMVVAADDEVAPAEKDRLEAHVAAGLELSEAERTRLSANLRWLLRQPPGWSGTQKRISALSQPQRHSIGKFLVQVAFADGRVAPEEVKILTKGFKLLGLDPATVHDELHAASLGVAPPADGPVVVKLGAPDMGTAIPRRGRVSGKEDAAAKQHLDMRLVSARLQETASVSALLARVFTEDPAGSSESNAAAEVVGSGGDGGIRGLDAVHSEFLRRLGMKPNWPRAEYENLAEELRLLPDGALDQLNQVALDLCAAPLLEGEDPIDVDLDVYKEIMA